MINFSEEISSSGIKYYNLLYEGLITRLKELPLRPREFSRSKILFSNLHWPPLRNSNVILSQHRQYGAPGSSSGFIVSNGGFLGLGLHKDHKANLSHFRWSAVARMAGNSLSGRRIMDGEIMENAPSTELY